MASLTVDTNASPDKQMSSLANSQYQYYKDNYIPFENNLIANATGDTSGRVNSILASLGQSQGNLQGIQRRTMSRYGFAQDPRQAAAGDRMNSLNNAAQTAAARNYTAQTLYDQNNSMLGAMASLGRGLSTQSIDGLQTAMSNQAARDAQYSNAMQAYRTARAQYNSSPFTLYGLK